MPDVRIRSQIASTFNGSCPIRLRRQELTIAAPPDRGVSGLTLADQPLVGIDTDVQLQPVRRGPGPSARR